MALKKIWKHTAIGVGTFQTVSMTSVRNWVVSSMSHTTARPVPPEGWTSDLHCWQPHDNTMYKQCRSHTVLTSHSCIQTTDMQKHGASAAKQRSWLQVRFSIQHPRAYMMSCMLQKSGDKNAQQRYGDFGFTVMKGVNYHKHFLV